MRDRLKRAALSGILALSIAASPVTVMADANSEYIAETKQMVMSGETAEFDEVSDLARLVQLGYSNNQSNGPVSITQGTLNVGENSRDIYLVCLSGTDTDVKNQTTGWWTDFLSGFQFDNKYNKNVRKIIKNNIPEGSNLVLAGHSLGGMIAQQVASDSEMKRKYNILNTVTFGSPLINGLSREGTVKRLGDTNDPVPYLSISTAYNIVRAVGGLNRENGGYKSDLYHAHTASYQRSDVWGGYDAVGVKHGSHTLTLDFSTTEFYHSPVSIK